MKNSSTALLALLILASAARAQTLRPVLPLRSVFTPAPQLLLPIPTLPAYLTALPSATVPQLSPLLAVPAASPSGVFLPVAQAAAAPVPLPLRAALASPVAQLPQEASAGNGVRAVLETLSDEALRITKADGASDFEAGRGFDGLAPRTGNAVSFEGAFARTSRHAIQPADGLKRPLMAEMPRIDGIRPRQSLARISTAMRTLGESIKFLRAYSAVALDLSRTDKIFEFADTDAVENSPHTRRLIDELRKDPATARLIAERRPMPSVDLQKLAGLPPDTLGGAYGRHMLKFGLSADFFKALKADTDYGFIALWARQTHDFWHVVTGYTPSSGDEIALQAFGMPLYPYAQLPAIIISAGLLNTELDRPQEAATFARRTALAWRRGQESRGMLAFRWDQELERPLSEIRQKLSLRPRDDGGPMESAAAQAAPEPARRPSLGLRLSLGLRYLAALRKVSGQSADSLVAGMRADAASMTSGDGGDAVLMAAARLLQAALSRPSVLPELMEAFAQGALEKR